MTVTQTRMLDHLRGHRAKIALGVTLSVGASAAGLLLPLVAQRLVDSLAASDGTLGLIGAVAAVVLVTAVLGAGGGYVLARQSEAIILQVRRRLIDRFVRLRVAEMDSADPGDLLARVTSDANLLREILVGAIAGGTAGAFSLVAAVTLMTSLDPTLMVITLVAVALASSILLLIAPRIRSSSKVAQTAIGEMGASLERGLGRSRTIKAAVAEPTQVAVITEAARRASAARITAAKWTAIASSISGLAVQLAFLAVVTVGGARVAAGTLDIGSLVAFLLYVFLLMPAVDQLVGALTKYQVGSAAMERLAAAQAMSVEPSPEGGHAIPGSGPCRVDFDRVWFRHPEAPSWVHEDLSFTIPPGSFAAVVGPSGSGKSSLLYLCERFYEVSAGSVSIGGSEVRELSTSQLRRSIAYVEQEAPLLSGTLADNLLLGNEKVGRSEITRALEVVQLTEVVDGLPAGLETHVGHGGVKLSGGERQRVAIARALLRRPRLLLLDEVTAHLDAENERALVLAVERATEHATVLMVAHRLSVVRSADQIIVLDGGRVRAVGPHEQLLGTDAYYAGVAAMQLAG